MKILNLKLEMLEDCFERETPPLSEYSIDSVSIIKLRNSHTTTNESITILDDSSIQDSINKEIENQVFKAEAIELNNPIKTEEEINLKEAVDINANSAMKAISKGVQTDGGNTSRLENEILRKQLKVLQEEYTSMSMEFKEERIHSADLAIQYQALNKTYNKLKSKYNDIIHSLNNKLSISQSQVEELLFKLSKYRAGNVERKKEFLETSPQRINMMTAKMKSGIGRKVKLMEIVKLRSSNTSNEKIDTNILKRKVDIKTNSMNKRKEESKSSYKRSTQRFPLAILQLKSNNNSKDMKDNNNESAQESMRSKRLSVRNTGKLPPKIIDKRKPSNQGSILSSGSKNGDAKPCMIQQTKKYEDEILRFNVKKP